MAITWNGICQGIVNAVGSVPIWNTCLYWVMDSTPNLL